MAEAIDAWRGRPGRAAIAAGVDGRIASPPARVVRVDDIEIVAADKLVRRVAQRGLDVLGDRVDLARRVHLGDDVEHVLGERAVACLALTQRILGQAALRHIARGALDESRAVRAVHDAGIDLDPD